jgi:DNA-binding NarL/FixJ family response regulator
VAEGRSVVDSRIVERLLAAQRRGEDSRLDAVTPREPEILAVVAEGWSNGAISERLGITKRAVERQIHSIFWKSSSAIPRMSADASKRRFSTSPARSGNTV